MSTKIKVILYPIFAHSAISRLEIKVTFNFTKLTCICSVLGR